MILGLDVSTSITGATVLDRDGVLIRNEAWDTRNKNRFDTLYSKAESIRDGLWRMEDLYSIENVFIEQPFTFFNSGGSTARTMATLQRFNGMVSWMCREIFNCDPVHLTAAQARKAMGISIKRGENAKAKVLQFILDTEPSFEVLYTKHGNPKPECFDKADSLVIAKAGYELCKQRN